MNRLVSCFCSLVVVVAEAATAPARVVIWDPVVKSSEPRITLDPNIIRRAANGLSRMGVDVRMLTAEQIANPDFAGASDYDAIVIPGEFFPEAMSGVIKKFADDGGVVVAISLNVPLLNRIVPDPVKGWRLSPEKPKFAWQTGKLIAHLGLSYKYKPQYHDMGVRHVPTPVMERFAPGLPALDERPPVAWSPPRPGVRMYPLVASYRSDGYQVPGLLYVLENGRRRSIFCVAPKLLLGTDPDSWPHSDRTFAAVVEIARRLRAKEAVFKESDCLVVSMNPPDEKRLPLRLHARGEIDPEGAMTLQRWGKFDGSCLELQDGSIQDGQLPRTLAPGEAVALALPNEAKTGIAYLRVRGAYASTGAGLSASIGPRQLLNEVFLGGDTDTCGNFGTNLRSESFQFTRVVPVPMDARKSGKPLVLANVGWRNLTFDALQIERPSDPRVRSIGLGQPNPHANVEQVDKTFWGPLRSTIRMSEAKEHGDDRLAGPEQWSRSLRLNDKTLQYEGLFERCPPWLAQSSERLILAQNAGRAMWVKPRADEFASLCADYVARHASEYDRFEIWNECDIHQFWRGTATEYAELYLKTESAIRKVAPDVEVMPAGLAGFNPSFIRRLVDAGVYARTKLVPMHPYAGQSACWDLSYGRVEGYFMSLGVGTEIYPNESGFPSCSMEWFKPPPDWTPKRQADMLNVAMARLLANAVSKLSVFTAGGSEHGYGLVDASGVPKPAYAVWADYARMNADGAVRLDASILRADGSPVAGVYVAGAMWADGTCVFVLNPAECDVSRPIDVVLSWVSANGVDCSRTVSLRERTVVMCRAMD